ncbi:MAG TPA: cbb3-type cytochrome c oxidase subunit I [Thermoanaerobaculaceae bacterium]|nr:cbb3-type cytochrome c oxidase subunit I [Thermoanaerobaculaceae bacterium]HPS76671.1 cbb3-type cytochrome c oxidase subunit I [Thermoanaerobaculaceae bacterium]
MSTARLKWAAIICFIVAMAGLLGGGFAARERVAPYPGKVVDPAGHILFTRADILAGQDIYQRYGLMDHGSVWGHGSQRGTEFSAVTLHEWGKAVEVALASAEHGKPVEALSTVERQAVDARVAVEMKTNRYDKATDTLQLSAVQASSLDTILNLWEHSFGAGDPRYGFLPDTVPTANERRQIGRFFTWTAWAAVVNRPGEDYSFTSNWPADKLVGNTPSPETYIWSLAGILSLFLALGLFIFFVHYFELWYGPAKGVPLAEKLIDSPLTASQVRAAKFFLVVILLFLVQTSFGGLLAHYTVHPGTFYVQKIANLIPYSWAKSWHLQLAIFWIATTWVASAIYLAPIIGGREPRRQGLLVQLLFGAILLVAVGSLVGEVAGIKGKLGEWWFWLGHQGWEYLELGRLWQILLFVGLIAWLVIVYRAVGHLLRGGVSSEFRSLIVFYVFSAILVVAFFGFGLFYGRGTHLTVADYWRWFVVHIWVESIFEFFGVAVIALVMVAMGLVSAKAAIRVAYFTAAIVFLSGILGTAHHYFWYGGPSFWLAVGSVFSSLEPIPMFGLVVRGMMEYRSVRKEGKEFPYRWPLYFLVASSFWNFLGAGVFGFLINLPIVNYYEHGTYLTMNHGHGALFGTYGMLSIALLLFSWRGMVQREAWNDKLLKVSFWGLNAGLLLMTLGTLFPVGIAQTWTAYKDGLWAARDASFFERGLVQAIGTIRAVPDLTIILFGVIPLTIFLFRTYPKLKAEKIAEGESIWDRLGFKP